MSAEGQPVPDPNVGLILHRLDQQDVHLHEIKAQVQVTNGRVGKLEIWQARVEGAKWAVSWVPPLVTALAAGGLGAALTKLLS